MATVRISTPDGAIPGPDPVEGVHYTVLGGAPSENDLVCVNGTVFCRYHAPYVTGPTPQVLTWGALAAYLIGLLGGGATGRAALGAIMKSCQASAQGADNFFAVYFQGQTVFTKEEFTGVLADVATGIVSNGQKAAVASNWPT